MDEKWAVASDPCQHGSLARYFVPMTHASHDYRLWSLAGLPFRGSFLSPLSPRLSLLGRYGISASRVPLGPIGCGADRQPRLNFR